MELQITPLYAALAGIFMALLSIRVPVRRAALNAPWGDGGDPELATRIRVFGNFIEYVPMTLLLLVLLELQGAAPAWLHGPGVVLLIARGVHAVSLRHGQNPGLPRKIGRGIGAMGSWLVLMVVSGRLLYGIFTA